LRSPRRYAYDAPQVSVGQRLAIATGLLVPGLVGFTTVGRLWLLPGPLLIAAGIIVLTPVRKEVHEATRTLGKHWASILTAILAAEYLFLGATALGRAGALGILGGLAILALLVTAPHIGSVGAPLALVVEVGCLLASRCLDRGASLRRSVGRGYDQRAELIERGGARREACSALHPKRVCAPLGQPRSGRSATKPTWRAPRMLILASKAPETTP
jgi:hypothetical protein